ncbi:hypothetical protein LUZ60_014332 [Juncus effusus]|nr:hypothetical protein LUZ60_014332 [Juncus effusus]
MATTLHSLHFPPIRPHQLHLRRTRRAVSVRAFGRSDVDRLVRDAWRGTNEGFERLAFEARLAAQRIDRKYSVGSRLDAAARAARLRVREIDAELGIGQRWRSFSVDFQRNWPRYRKQLNDFSKTPIGKGLGTLFFVWFLLSGWFFRIFFFATWVLPFAAPILIGAFANNFAIEGTCPACKTRFRGMKNQVVRCSNCQNIVWQPKDNFSRGRGSSSSSRRNSDPDIIDVEFEEK